MDKFSLVGNQEISAVEEIYRNYLENPDSIEPSWRNFFEGFELARKSYLDSSVSEADENRIQKEFRILNLINGYRQRGHLLPEQTRSEKEEPTRQPSIIKISDWMNLIWTKYSMQGRKLE